MSVTIAENDGKTWYEFGKRNLPYDGRTYIAWIEVEDEVESIHFTLEGKIPETQPPYYWSQLEVPLSLFKSVVKKLENSKRAIKLGTHGTFEKEGSSVLFTLPCGEMHTFELEDLLTLVDQL